MLLRFITSALLVTSFASAEVVVDQIGPMDGSSLGDSISSSQYFEPIYSSFNIATLENIILTDERRLIQMEFVLNGWEGFTDPTSVSSYECNFYSTSSVAEKTLTGDLSTDVIDVADAVVSDQWYGQGFLLAIPIDAVIPAGGYWFSVIPENNVEPTGRTGIQESLIGDSTHCLQVNPGEGFGFGTIRSLYLESAFRITDDVVIDECTVELPDFCSEDINGDGFVSIADILVIIANWGSCGDGEFRPEGDCAPLPYGDCCVNVTDILGVVAAWGNECVPHGACCLQSGQCEDIYTEADCLLSDGIFFGPDTTCEVEQCYVGACCLEDTCDDTSLYFCLESDGLYRGEFTACATTDCTLQEAGDECSTAIEAVLGINPFTTLTMTPSEPVPDDTLCEFSNLEWGNSPDVWLEFSPASSGGYSFTTCDNESYDTSIVLYENDCLTQISCNGDSDNPDENCQEYYSIMSYELIEGITYFIRIGGWFEETGNGNLTISQLPPPIPGACCFATGSCLDDLTPADCEIFGGNYMGTESTCSESDCIDIQGDDCNEPRNITSGVHDFSIVYATPSEDIPDESFCEGTYLGWKFNPDVWFKWIAPSTGMATFSTCGNATFDTSLVLYEGSCSNQVSCNGDAEENSDCQNYYSLIVYPVTAGTEYLIRLGGYQGAIGEGTLTVLGPGEGDLGACCIEGICESDVTNLDCTSSGGTWVIDETCKTIVCDPPPCQFAIVTQVPDAPDEDWFASNSSYDPSSGIYEKAERVNIETMQSVSFWGLQAYYNGSWNSCNENYTFTVRTYEDNEGLPGELIREESGLTALKIPTGEIYAGSYELMQWQIDFEAENVAYISIQSESDSLDCWFLWMSSGGGDGTSYEYSDGSWLYNDNDLSLCIE